MDLGRSGLDPKNAVAISVADTGIGIPADQQKVIFEAFQQVDGTTARKYGGTGLGLSISRESATLLGGEIQLQSTMGQGSTFTLSLPTEITATRDEIASRTLAPALGQSVPMQSPSSRRAGSRKTVTVPDDRDDLTPEDTCILIIEDDVAFAGVLLNQCHEKGFKCLVATTGEDGLELARQHLPKAVILDLKLPPTDGWRRLEPLQEHATLRR